MFTAFTGPKTASPRPKFNRLRICITLFTLTLGLPALAKAGFVVQLGLNLQVNSGSRTEIDFGGAAGTPFVFNGFFTDLNTHGIELFDLANPGGSPNLIRLEVSSQKIRLHNLGDSIDGNASFAGTTKLLHGLANGALDPEGNWATGRGGAIQNLSGYVGVQFSAANNPPDIHYGWIHYTALSTSPSTPFSTGVIDGWGYNTTPGEKILAGVPEPSAVGVLISILVSLGTLNRHRRRA